MTNQAIALEQNDAESTSETQEVVEAGENQKVEALSDTLDNQTEERARRMGWIPKEEYKGHEENWVDAETFYNRSLEELPIMRENFKKLERKYEAQERESRQAIQDIKDHATRVEKLSYERAMKELLREQKEAVSDGDVERFDQIEKEKQDLQKGKKEAVEVQEPNQVDPYEQQQIQDWINKELWYKNDVNLQAAANTYEAFLSSSQPSVPLRERLDMVSAHIKKTFPEKFGINPNRQLPPTVEGANKVSRRKPNAKSYENLPSEAKKVCDRQVKRGELTKEEFLKYYEWE